jgi:hypothetical protein
MVELSARFWTHHAPLREDLLVEAPKLAREGRFD